MGTWLWEAFVKNVRILTVSNVLTIQTFKYVHNAMNIILLRMDNVWMFVEMELLFNYNVIRRKEWNLMDVMISARFKLDLIVLKHKRT